MSGKLELKMQNDSEFNRLIRLLNKYRERLPDELYRELKMFDIKPLIIDIDWIYRRGYNPPDITIMIDHKRVDKVERINTRAKVYESFGHSLKEFKNCKLFHKGKLIFEC